MKRFPLIFALALAFPAWAQDDFIAKSIEHTKDYVKRELSPVTKLEFGEIYAAKQGGGVTCGHVTVRGSAKVTDGPQRFMDTIGGLMFEKDVKAADKMPFEPQWQMWCL